MWARRYLVLIVFIALVQLVFFIGWLHQRHQLQEQSKQLQTQVTQINRSLCLRKADAIAGVREAKAFLRAHPSGTPDFSVGLIKKSIHDQEKIVAGLRDVQCPAPKS